MIITPLYLSKPAQHRLSSISSILRFTSWPPSVFHHKIHMSANNLLVIMELSSAMLCRYGSHLSVHVYAIWAIFLLARKNPR